MLSFIGNRYKILNCDGELEIDKLYEARDVYDNSKVLIKIIEHNEYISKDFLSNLIDEATMAREINSPYILNILDIGIHCTEITTFYYIVSEYTTSIGLDSIIKGNYIHLEAIINMSTQILKGLETAYSYDLYHGDLKPSNILVDENYNIKICDFGLTKANNGVNLRIGNNINYLCPHQICINYTDKESDFFSLGLILFEAIFKKLPYKETKDENELLKLIDKGINWNNLKAINGNDQLIDIVKKLLSRTDKYDNTQEIIIDLSSVMYEKADITSTLPVLVDLEYENKEKKKNSNKFVLATGIVAIISFMVLSLL